MARLERFKSFVNNKINEAQVYDKVRIFDNDQHLDFLAYLKQVTNDSMVSPKWNFLSKTKWSEYLGSNSKLALIHTEEEYEGEKLIAALLNNDGEVIEAHYNDGTECDYDVAEDYLNEMPLVIKENSQFDESLSDDLIKAIKRQDANEVAALLESGADLSYNNWLPLKTAIEVGNLDILEATFSEIDEGELSEEEAKELVEYCVFKRLPPRTERFVKFKVDELLLGDN